MSGDGVDGSFGDGNTTTTKRTGCSYMLKPPDILRLCGYKQSSSSLGID